MDAKTEMKRRMAEAKAKQQENIAKIKALKAAAPKPAPAPAPAPKAAVHKPPDAVSGSKRPLEDGTSAVFKKPLPPGFFDTEGSAARPPAGAAAPALLTGAVQHVAAPAPDSGAGATSAPVNLEGGGGVMGLELAYGSSSGEEEEEEEPAQAKVAAPPAPAPAPAPAGASALPEGFFDDRTKDAIAHNRPAPKKLDIDEEFAAFTEEIEETLEILDKQEDEEIKQMVETRDKDERMETADMLSKVEELRKARKELMAKRAAESGGRDNRAKPKFALADDDEDDDASDDEDDDLNWRKKKA